MGWHFDENSLFLAFRVKKFYEVYALQQTQILSGPNSVGDIENIFSKFLQASLRKFIYESKLNCTHAKVMGSPRGEHVVGFFVFFFNKLHPLTGQYGPSVVHTCLKFARTFVQRNYRIQTLFGKVGGKILNAYCNCASPILIAASPWK